MNYRFSNTIVDIYRTMEFCKGIDVYYPDFSDWFINKVSPRICSGTDILLLCEQNQDLVGCVVANKTKLRCVRVSNRFKNRGISMHLLDKIFTKIDCDKPLTTVPEELFHDWSRILINRYDFNLVHVAKGLYRNGKLEYQFNNSLNQKIKSQYGEKIIIVSTNKKE